MFTGLIREIAKVKSYQNNILSINSKYIPKLGDSIAINGVCLSVTKLNTDGFELELSDETRAIIDESKLSGSVHIEPAMQMGDRFEGHVVQGHIDCIGKIDSITKRENSSDFLIKVEPKHMVNIVPKGSITIDGVSLTVNDVYDDRFRLTIIPITLKETLLGAFKKGDKVNIETDMFARYIGHILKFKNKKSSTSWGDIDNISMSY